MFLTHLGTIERAIAFVCRRGRLRDADAEDFASIVKLKLIENDYAIVRKFENRCSFGAYISIVIQRILFDYRVRMWGKWHASSEAKKLGDAAVMLEALLWRDERSCDDAVAIVARSYPDLTPEDIGRLVQRLPRRIRRREVELDCEDEHLSIPAETVHGGAFEGDRLVAGRRTAAAVQAVLNDLPETERTVLRMRFEAGMTVAEISRALGLEQKPLYRTIHRQLLRFRDGLQSAGISPDDVDDIVRAGAPGLDFDFSVRNEAASPSSIDGGAREREEESADETSEFSLLS